MIVVERTATAADYADAHVDQIENLTDEAYARKFVNWVLSHTEDGGSVPETSRRWLLRPDEVRDA